MEYKQLFKWLYGPIQNTMDMLKISDGGYSLRKAICCVIVYLIYSSHEKIKMAPEFPGLVVTLTIIDDVFICVLVGLIAAPEIIKLLTGRFGGPKQSDNGSETNI